MKGEPYGYRVSCYNVYTWGYSVLVRQSRQNPLGHSDRSAWYTAACKLCVLLCLYCVLGCELPKNIAAVILLLAVMASCVWIGIASGFLRTNRMRIPYISAGIGFNVVLGLILLNFYIGLL